MTVFIRLTSSKNKSDDLLKSIKFNDNNIFFLNPSVFKILPGSPFSYWVKENHRQVFIKFLPLEGAILVARQGLATADDYRFARIWWEVNSNYWTCFAKGGKFSPIYCDMHLIINWNNVGKELKAWASSLYNNSHWSRILKNVEYFFKPGLTWPRRTSSGLSMRIMPKNSIFADKGPAIFHLNNDSLTLLAIAALSTSKLYSLLLEMQLAAAEAAARSYEVGLIQQTPIPDLTPESTEQLAALARRAYYLKRTLDTINETSHAFILPEALRSRASEYDPDKIEQELADIQQEVDNLVFDLYGFDEADRAAIQTPDSGATEEEAAPDDERDEEEEETGPDTQTGLLSWAVGVAFGRFDWRLATQERDMPADPEPFDPLPAKSPGMLPDGATPFHTHQGILTDDPGHPHDLTRLVESVLEKVNVSVPANVQQWLRRDFFAEHLKQYSKSRRKAPIYWPLSTPSGSYTLWVYYPALTNQTLYSAVNDFLEPKLKQVQSEIATLREKGGGRNKQEEKQYEGLLSLEQELLEFRNVLLEIAPTYQPNHDDGVQITAAPLWQLFRHKPWQKVLKDTWAKFQKGDYDWAYLAMAYWPDRVREKCKTDKSLAIAHDLEDLYEEPIAAPKKGKKAGGSK